MNLDLRGLMTTKRTIRVWQVLVLIAAFLMLGGISGDAGVGAGVAVLMIALIATFYEPKVKADKKTEA